MWGTCLSAVVRCLELCQCVRNIQHLLINFINILIFIAKFFFYYHVHFMNVVIDFVGTGAHFNITLDNDWLGIILCIDIYKQIDH